MPHIKIGNLSTNQLSKLRNRHSVRIKPGDALHVNLDDLNYNYAIKKLSKGRGVNLTLTDDEISKNAEMNGGKLFKKVGKAFHKNISEKDIQNVSLDLEPKKELQQKVKKELSKVQKKLKKQVGGKLKLKRKPNKLVNVIAKHVAKPALQLAGKPYETTVGFNPATAGYHVGHDIVAPAVFGKGVDIVKSKRGRKPKVEAIREKQLSEFSTEQLEEELKNRMKGKGLTLSKSKKGEGLMLGKGHVKKPMGMYGEIEGTHHSNIITPVQYPNRKYYT